MLNYKKLNELIPELQSLVESGALKSTTAYKIWAKKLYDFASTFHLSLKFSLQNQG
ncbi:hypothetical protein G8T75_12765 [Clostridium botulinum D/C]|uniref:hypothetical protein n=1 Tax=Clostridium botulinum TaxID=1491 RepID=UPI001E59FCD8|nr:hypothetical protein [Clostridium botulinum]MCD3240829.1 hypothetical protein [Clostridium botulinum D/C]